MSRGELSFDDNQVKQTASSSGDWATEYQQQYNAGSAWADEFVRKKPSINVVTSWNSDFLGFLLIFH